MHKRAIVAVEMLESRRLFAGVTILTHGYQGDTTGWVDTAAKDIQARFAGPSGGVGPDDPAIAKLVVTAVNGALAVAYDGLGNVPLSNTTQAEQIIELDWSTVSTGSYSTKQVAAAVADYMLNPPLQEVAQLAALPLHFIGHSRGASLNVALSRELGERGVWVDQNTFLDPHPVEGVDDFFGANFGDEKMAVYDNVEYSDNYWRTDGNPNNSDFDGEPVAGSFNGNLAASVQQEFFVSAHGAVTAYYNGTIDLASLDGGDHPVIPSWYGTTAAKPPRDATGYDMSRLANGPRARTGLSGAVGGTATRVTVGASGSQFSNVAGLQLRPGTNASGDTLRLQTRYADRDSATQLTFFLDFDRNPFTSVAKVLTTKTVASTPLALAKADASLAGVEPGTYYVGVKAKDADGHERYVYNETPVDITNLAPPLGMVISGVLRIDGTAGADVITVQSNGPGGVIIGKNDATQAIASGINSVQIFAGQGTDNVNLAGLLVPAYVDGGLDRDTLRGGEANDTLTGGASTNYLYGGFGDDRLNGSSGNDFLYGETGNDRLYGNGGSDFLSGGSNVDRLFAGDGDDILVGNNGNDKLYGDAGNDRLTGGLGSDIMNGGAGTDSADNDAADQRTDIENILA